MQDEPRERIRLERLDMTLSLYQNFVELQIYIQEVQKYIEKGTGRDETWNMQRKQKHPHFAISINIWKEIGLRTIWRLCAGIYLL